MKNVIFIGNEVGSHATRESNFVTMGDDGTFKLAAINCGKANIDSITVAIESLKKWKKLNGDKNERRN